MSLFRRSLRTWGAFLGMVLVSQVALASAAEDAIYYWGVTKSLAGNKSCAVKLNAADEALASLEALVFMAHEGKYVYTDALDLTFDTTRQAYVFNSTEVRPNIKQAVLFLDAQGLPARFAASIFHHNHYDPAFCENLMEAQGQDIALAQEFFNNFGADAEEDHEEHDDDHDHDHDHHHDHDHDHDHDH